jgi:hypothetical protein
MRTLRGNVFIESLPSNSYTRHSIYRYDLKVCDDGTLVQILGFRTLSIALSYVKCRPVYFSKHNVSETGFCFCLQVKLTQLGPIDIEIVPISGPLLLLLLLLLLLFFFFFFFGSPEIGTSSIDWTQLSRFYLKTETESSLRNVVFLKRNRTTFFDKDKTMDNVQKCNICSIYRAGEGIRCLCETNGLSIMLT